MGADMGPNPEQAGVDVILQVGRQGLGVRRIATRAATRVYTSASAATRCAAPAADPITAGYRQTRGARHRSHRDESPPVQFPRSAANCRRLRSPVTCRCHRSLITCACFGFLVPDFLVHVILPLRLFDSLTPLSSIRQLPVVKSSLSLLATRTSSPFSSWPVRIVTP